MSHSVLQPITVVANTFVSDHGEDYAAALREAIETVRLGTRAEIEQGGEVLHTYDELKLASQGLDQYFDDEELIDEVHYASKRLEGAVTR